MQWRCRDPNSYPSLVFVILLFRPASVKNLHGSKRCSQSFNRYKQKSARIIVIVEKTLVWNENIVFLWLQLILTASSRYCVLTVSGVRFYSLMLT